MLREWASSEIFYSLYAQYVLVNVSTCNYIILRSLIFRRVISVHHLISMPIRVPQCLKFKFSIVKCVYLLFDTTFVYFSIAYYHTVGFIAAILKMVHQLFSHFLQYQPIWCVQQIFSISQVQNLIPIVFCTHLWAMKQACKTQKRMERKSFFTNTTL